MRAHLDENLNTQFGDVVGGAPMIIAQRGAPILGGDGVLEPEFNSYASTQWGKVSLYSAPRVIPTAAVGKNPWDIAYGPPTSTYSEAAPAAALDLSPQTSPDGN